MNRKPFIYVAGPISTGGDVIGNCRRGIHVGEQLRKLGYIPFVPHLSVIHEMVTEAISWDQWLEYDEQIILRCDALFRMSGDSRGADREVEFAKANRIPVFDSFVDLRLWYLAWREMQSIKPCDPEAAGFVAKLAAEFEKVTIDELQREVGSWGDATFKSRTQDSIIKHLRKEANVELAPDCDGDELADIALLLMHLAHVRGLSLRDQVRKKFEINKARKWGAVNAEGFTEHVREVQP